MRRVKLRRTAVARCLSKDEEEEKEEEAQAEEEQVRKRAEK